MRAVVVMQDKGGALGALPVASELKARGHDVRIVVHPESAAVTMLSGAQNSANLSYETPVATDRVLQEHAPDVLVVAMDPFPRFAKELTMSAKGRVPVIALTDTHGTGLTTGWGSQSEPLPDYVVVNDILGAEMIAQAWPDFPAENIWATGFPALDRLVTINESLARQARRAMNIERDPIVLFGDAGESSAHAFLELVRALNQRKLRVELIPRLRPDTPQRFPDELRTYWAACEEYRFGRVVFSSQVKDTTHLIAAARVTISSYSTMLQEAAALHLPNIGILYEPQLADFHRAYAHLSEPAVMTLGCTTKATNLEELAAAVSNALYGDLGLKTSQEQHFKLDGMNASRVVDKILAVA